MSPSACLYPRRERSKVPYIVRQCVEEVEKRGIEEVGIYRISGVATDIQALKAVFDASEWSWGVGLGHRKDKTGSGGTGGDSCRINWSPEQKTQTLGWQRNPALWPPTQWPGPFLHTDPSPHSFVGWH